MWPPQGKLYSSWNNPTRIYAINPRLTSWGLDTPFLKPGRQKSILLTSSLVYQVPLKWFLNARRWGDRVTALLSGREEHTHLTKVFFKKHKPAHFYLHYKKVVVHSIKSDSSRPRGLQHTRLPCPSVSPRVYSTSYPLSRWCYKDWVGHSHCALSLLFDYERQTFFKNKSTVTSPVVQWLRLHAASAGDMGSIPSQGTKIPYATQSGQKIKK